MRTTHTRERNISKSGRLSNRPATSTRATRPPMTTTSTTLAMIKARNAPKTSSRISSRTSGTSPQVALLARKIGSITIRMRTSIGHGLPTLTKSIIRGRAELPTQRTKTHRNRTRVSNTVAHNISRNQMTPTARQAGGILRRLLRRKPRKMSFTDSIISRTTRKRLALALGKSSRTRANRGLSRTQTSTHSKHGGFGLSQSLRPIRSMSRKKTATFIALTAGTINGTSTRQVRASGVAS
jgi:hypothetical protein